MNIKQSLLLVTLFACSLSANEQLEKLFKDNYRIVDRYKNKIDGSTDYKLEKPAKFLRYIPVGKDVVTARETSTGVTIIENEKRIYDYSDIRSYALIASPYALMIGGVLAIIKSKR